ncbi:MAG TPA: hypothetical protein VH680_12575 [Gemmatimonadales bacterium]
MGLFIQHPFLAAAIGLVLVGLGGRSHRRGAIGVGIMWLLYAVYETGMQQRWLCSGECNIRVDLLLIYPLLILGLIAAGVGLLRAPKRPRPPN